MVNPVVSEKFRDLANTFCNDDDKSNHPINCINWYQAEEYCKSLGKQLPTEEEWEYAARGGKDNRVYPWGNDPPDEHRLNACGPECPAISENGKKSTKFTTKDKWPQTAPVGQFLKGASPSGALDMAGNVWEWTADFYSEEDSGKPMKDRYRVERGGGWNSTDPVQFRATRRNKDEPLNRNFDIGFRCAWSPPKMDKSRSSD
jgi:formylglycine-generating enzyme required for sulfatase activity